METGVAATWEVLVQFHRGQTESGK